MNPKSRQQVIAFYDQFAQDQLLTGTNIRHRTILRNLKKLGLRRQSHVLEIGCGVGTLTGLIGKYCRKGLVVATDISRTSIDLAKERTQHLSHVRYILTDMRDFAVTQTFDFIVLPDVLEHIPIENHSALFATLFKRCHARTVVAINIPDPFILQWYHKHEPDKLQIVDQPLHTDVLLQRIYANNFFLESLTRYALHTQEPDYQWIVIKPRMDLSVIHHKSKWRLRRQSLMAKIFY